MSSTTESTPETGETGLLSMPNEILQNIAESVDVTILRLTCKTIEAAVFDVFAKQYLEELQYFMLDPSRLRSLKAIATHEKFKRKIKTVSLTLDPWDSKMPFDIQVAHSFRYTNRQPGDHSRYRFFEQVTAWQSRTQQDYDKCGRHLAVGDLLVEVMRDLNMLQSVHVAMNLWPKNFEPQHAADSTRVTISEDVIQSIMSVVVSSGCKVSELLVHTSHILTPEFRNEGQAVLLESFAKALTTFKIECPAKEVDEDFSSEESISMNNYWPATSILAFADGLQSLSVAKSPGYYCSRGKLKGALQYATAILSASKLSNLRHLDLCSLDIEPEDLTKVLKGCEPTLQHLELQELLVFRLASFRKEILWQLSRCQQLAKLKLSLRFEEGYDGSGCTGIAHEIQGKSAVKEAIVWSLEHDMSAGQPPAWQEPPNGRQILF